MLPKSVEAGVFFRGMSNDVRRQRMWPSLGDFILQTSCIVHTVERSCLVNPNLHTTMNQ